MEGEEGEREEEEGEGGERGVGVERGEAEGNERRREKKEVLTKRAKRKMADRMSEFQSAEN